MFVLVRMQFHNHVDIHDTTSETFRKGYAMYTRYKFGMLQVRKNDISLRKCSDSCAHLSNLEETLVTGILYNSITMTVNLNRKLDYLSSQKKIKFFQRHISSKAFFHFPNVTMSTNVFRKEAIADDKVEEY